MKSNLQSLFNQFDACERCRRENNPLRHILGGGRTERPRFLFLFINPTHQNSSSHPEYGGERRFPFLGVRYFWKLMARAGVVDEKIVEDIYERGWQTKDEHAIEAELIKRSIYITNLVKCTQPHADNPSKEIVAADLPLLWREIELVKPDYIIAFGKLPTSALTDQDVTLRDYFAAAEQGTYQPLTAAYGGKEWKVLPCYFPVGRGNPPKALAILKYTLNTF